MSDAADLCIRLAADRFGTSPKEMRTYSMSLRIAMARRLAAYYMKNLLHMTSEDAAWELNRDASQISRYVRKVVRDIKQDPIFAEKIKPDEDKIRSQYPITIGGTS